MKEEIHVEFSNDILDFLNSNHISLEEILISQQLGFTVVEKISPYSDGKEDRNKDVVLVILASSVAIVSIAYAISSVLHEIYRRPHVVEIFEDIEVRDNNGNLVFDENKNFLVRRVKKTEIINPSRESIENEVNLHIDLKKGMSVKFRTYKNDK